MAPKGPEQIAEEAFRDECAKLALPHLMALALAIAAQRGMAPNFTAIVDDCWRIAEMMVDKRREAITGIVAPPR
jgi:hypothetical protein